MLKRILLAVFALASIVILASPRVEALQISAPFVTVGVGDTFTIPISITDAVDLEFFQFDLSFAPLIVQANTGGATAGGLLPSDWFFTSPGAVDNTNGDILGVSASGSAFSGCGVIANFEFTALASGVSALTFSNLFLNLSDQGFNIANGQITVTGTTSVPEPSTLLLFMSGLGLLGARRLFRSRGRG